MPSTGGPSRSNAISGLGSATGNPRLRVKKFDDNRDHDVSARAAFVIAARFADHLSMIGDPWRRLRQDDATAPSQTERPLRSRETS